MTEIITLITMYKIITDNEHLVLDFTVDKSPSPDKHNILVLDVSASMGSTISLLQKFTLELLNDANVNSFLSIVIFSTDAEIILEKQPIEQVPIQEVVDKVTINGSTNGIAAVEKTNEIIQKFSDDLFNVLFLSDGHFNSNSPTEGTFKDLVLKSVGNKRVLFNCVGFTEYHDQNVLHQLTTSGSLDGQYISIYNESEIYSIIDSLIDPEGKYIFNVTVKYGDQENKFSQIDTNNIKTCVFKYNPTVKTIGIFHNTKKIKQIRTSTSKKCENMLHMKTHILREKIVNSFSLNTSKYDEFCLLNDEVILLMNDYALLPNDETKQRDVKILTQLNNDLADIIRVLKDQKIGNSSAQLLLKYASEHKNQLSLSTLKNQRICYNSGTGNILNLKLIKKMKDDTSGVDKSSIQIEQDDPYGISKKQVDNMGCYVSHEKWRETILGVGLHILPKTTREIQRDLLPDIKMDCNYLSVESFNDGVEFTYKKSPEKLEQDRDAPINNTQLINELEQNQQYELGLGGTKVNHVVRSSVNGYVNCWIPIYINEYHWSDAKYYMDSAISLIAYQNNNVIDPEKVIDVYANLFIRNIVTFIETESMPDMSIQMFAYLYRTLLALIDDSDTIQDTVNKRLKDFIEIPHMRTRRHCSNIGDIINLLLVSDKYTWDDMKPYYVPEMIRRSTIRVDVSQLTPENLIEKFDEMSGEFYKKTILVIQFLKVLRCKTLAKTKEYFDNRWGLLDKTKIDKIKRGFNNLLKTNDLKSKLALINYQNDEHTISNLILWGIYRQNSMCEVVFGKKCMGFLDLFRRGELKLVKDTNKEKREEDKEQKIRRNVALIYPDASTKYSKAAIRPIKEELSNKISDIIGANPETIKITLFENYGFVKFASTEDLIQLFNKTNELKLDKVTFYFDLNKVGQEEVKKSKDYHYKRYSKSRYIYRAKQMAKGKVENRNIEMPYVYNPEVEKTEEIKDKDVYYKNPILDNVEITEYTLEEANKEIMKGTKMTILSKNNILVEWSSNVHTFIEPDCGLYLTGLKKPKLIRWDAESNVKIATYVS